ncbi:hypothetical protein GE21DRAFT_1313839 [Neurospora crassa]|nr:hypothetical protein GE21DRAFT_1313839 [Neurospora crassa]
MNNTNTNTNNKNLASSSASVIFNYFNLQFKDKILFKKKRLSKVKVVSLNKIYATILTKLKKSFYFVFDKIISFSERVILSGVPIRVDKDASLYKELILLRKYKLRLDLNKLNNLIMKYYNKKVEFNIVNMRSFLLNKNKFKNLNLSFILNDASYAERNNLSELLNKLYYNVLLVSQKGSGGSPTKFIQKGAGAASLGGNAKAQPKVSSFAKAKKYAKIYQIIFNSINYKNMGGLRLEIKGGLKNLDSSYKGLSSVNMRGYAKPNVEYSIFTSKRRIGAFAVKG